MKLRSPRIMLFRLQAGLDSFMMVREDQMKRRNVLLAIIALFTPLPLIAQTAAKVYRIGYLDGGLPSTSKANVEGLRQGFKDLGYVEGRNFVFDFRWGE